MADLTEKEVVFEFEFDESADGERLRGSDSGAFARDFFHNDTAMESRGGIRIFGKQSELGGEVRGQARGQAPIHAILSGLEGEL